MKAQRRHELQTNTLAERLSNLPEFWNKHGTKVLLVLVAIALVIVLIRYRISSARQATLTAARRPGDYAAARWSTRSRRSIVLTPKQFAMIRTQYAADARARSIR